MKSSASRWGPWLSLLVLSPVLIGGPWFAYDQHFRLPAPLSELTDPLTNLPQISEERILGVAKHLSEGIGYRTVGTYEHALADEWMLQTAEQAKQDCESIVAQTGRKLECEVWHQQGSGNHRFDMMGKRLYKTYVNLTNIIVRVSDGTAAGKEHALLVNAHLDSTLPSPGAADDALSVGVMLDCMRVLINTPEWSPKHAIIFLFNHAEESLQDGSHLFSTQHPIAPTVRAAVNLEAAGTTGREILFQATSEEMIEAYSHVPRPYGTIFANDIFSSGIIMSDTDFRQFELYLNVTGLDMAIVGNSYLYHMRKDLVENIEPGAAQHMAENALALLRYLSSEGSPLPGLTEGYTKPTTVFFAHVERTFFIYSFTTAKIIYTILFIASFALVKFTFIDPAPALKKGHGFWREQIKGSVAVGAGVVGTLLLPNIVAVIMRNVLHKPMSWFKSPLAPIGLYGPTALLGALVSQYLVGETHEESVFSALLLVQAFLALIVQLMNVGSAAVFFLTALPLFVAWASNPIFLRIFRSIGSEKISLATYGVGQLLPAVSSTLLILGVCDVFVPLTGRMGGDAPADNIIAIIISVLGAIGFPLALPFAHRYGHKRLGKGIALLSVVVATLIGVYASMDVFDDMHQKRLFVLHSENITTGEHHLHIAAADGAPGFELLVKDVVKEFSSAQEQRLVPVIMNDYNNDWDSLYPFSAFLTPYKAPLSVDPTYISPWVKDDKFRVTAVDHPTSEVEGSSRTRNITVHIAHPSLIWTAIAFDAHVLSWSLDQNPPDEYARHHIKEGSFYGHDAYSFNMVIKLPEVESKDDQKLKVNFVGLQENGMWPAKKSIKTQGGPAMKLFEKLDAWLEEKTAGTVDALLMGSIGGVVDI